jgi:ATP-dependent RNA helicase DeaD
MLIFVRTKTATLELAEKLEARGYDTAALNGDIPQSQRERTVQQLKNGKLDILVATDVAARGLDVERISHVVNYDIPYDTEAYVHRIGRTGRAGRKGDAILFVAPRERRMLGAIEKATRQKIDIMELPSTELINDQRIAKFKQRITDTLANEELELFTSLIEQYEQEHNVPAQEVAAALARLLQGDTPFLMQHKPQRKADKSRDTGESPPHRKQAGKPAARSPGKSHNLKRACNAFDWKSVTSITSSPVTSSVRSPTRQVSTASTSAASVFLTITAWLIYLKACRRALSTTSERHGSRGSN